MDKFKEQIGKEWENFQLDVQKKLDNVQIQIDDVYKLVSDKEVRPHFHRTDRIDIQDLKGGLRILSTTTERAEDGSIRLFSKNGISYFAIKINSTATIHPWKKVMVSEEENSFFPGHVHSNGSTISLPSGWTSSFIDNGHYRITHNLGTTDYYVVANACYGGGGVADFAMVGIKLEDYFDVYTFMYNGNVCNIPVAFILTTY